MCLTGVIKALAVILIGSTVYRHSDYMSEFSRCRV